MKVSKSFWRHSLFSSVASFALSFPSYAVEEAPPSVPNIAQATTTATNQQPAAQPTTGPAVSSKEPFDEKVLYEQVFGKKASAQEVRRELKVPVLVDGEKIGDVYILAPLDLGPAKIDQKGFSKVLEEVVLPEHLQFLESKVDNLGYISTDNFEDVPFRAHFDAGQLVIQVEIPMELRKTQAGSLRSRRPSPIGRRIDQSTASAYLNFSFAQDFRHGLDQNNGRQASILNFQGAMNLASVILEGDATYHEKEKRRWTRNEVRLIKDWPSKAVRFSVGDLSYLTSSFQTAPAIGGISVARNFSLRPYDVVQSSGTAAFTLTSESRVEFYVNGQLVEIRTLPAGPHRLTDFPLSTGANDITLRITDKFGRVEELKIPFFYSSALLNEGIHLYSYNAGYLMEPRDGVRHYDSKIPVFTMYHQYGLTPGLTIGANAQGSKKQTQVGLETLFATPIGNFQVRGSASQVRTDHKRGYAAIVQYDLIEGPDGMARNFSLQWRGLTQSFTGLGTLTPSNPISNLIAARYSQHLGGGVYGSLSSTYAFHRQIHGRENTQTFTLSKAYYDGLNLSLELARLKRPQTKVDQRMLIGLRWSIPDSRHSLSADYQSQDNTSRVRWNYASPGTPETFGASASAYRMKGQFGGDGDLNYTGNRFQAGVRHAHDVPKEGKTTDNTTLNLRTALVFADGHMALSRPISDAFVIVAPHERMRDKPLLVNKSGDTYTAKNDWMGPAVVNNAASYMINNVSLDRRNLPIGYEIESDSYYFEPTYHGGGVQKVGSDAVVVAQGKLLDEKNAPFSMATGEIISLEDEKTPPVTFFTNRKGGFLAEGLKPGRYKIVLYGEKVYSLFIEIPAGTEGLFKLDSQKMEALEADQKQLLQEVKP